MRKSQHAYFKAIKASKSDGSYIDTRALLETSKAAEKDFDNTIVEIMELQAKEQQPQIFNDDTKQ